MEKKRIVPLWVSIIYTILCAGAILYHVNLYSKMDAISVATGATVLCECMAFALALCYGYLSYGKVAAGFLTAFCAFYAASTAFVIFDYAAELAFIPLMLLLLRFGILWVFMLAKNLGKVKSLALVIVMVLGEILQFFLVDPANQLVYGGFKIILTLVLLFMVIAKYRDKAARGTN